MHRILDVFLFATWPLRTRNQVCTHELLFFEYELHNVVPFSQLEAYLVSLATMYFYVLSALRLKIDAFVYCFPPFTSCQPIYYYEYSFLLCSLGSFFFVRNSYQIVGFFSMKNIISVIRLILTRNNETNAF
jgi:hypothetical protein